MEKPLGGLLDFKTQCTEGLPVLSRLLSHHGRGVTMFPWCEEENLSVPVLSCIL